MLIAEHGLTSPWAIEALFYHPAAPCGAVRQTRESGVGLQPHGQSAGAGRGLRLLVQLGDAGLHLLPTALHQLWYIVAGQPLGADGFQHLQPYLATSQAVEVRLLGI